MALCFFAVHFDISSRSKKCHNFFFQFNSGFSVSMSSNCCYSVFVCYWLAFHYSLKIKWEKKLYQKLASGTIENPLEYYPKWPGNRVTDKSEHKHLTLMSKSYVTWVWFVTTTTKTNASVIAWSKKRTHKLTTNWQMRFQEQCPNDGIDALTYILVVFELLLRWVCSRSER